MSPGNIATNDTLLRKSFRTAETRATKDVVELLSQLRADRPPSHYANIFRTFRTAAPKAFQYLCVAGPRNPSTLVLVNKAFQPLSLENELLWASHWLSPHFGRINEFRERAAEIQKLQHQGATNEALQLLDEYIQATGWSLWSVELRAAFLQLSQGTSAQREWLRELQLRAGNSVPGLLFEVFGDRNDDTFSYDAIYGKCKASFPRFSSFAPWLVDYLNYRALADVDKPGKALPNILCRDISSSLIDYYESIVEALAYVENDRELSDLRKTASSLIASLLQHGYKDHRLIKLQLALESTSLATLCVMARPEEPYRTLYPGPFLPEKMALPAGVAADLAKCQDEGAAAYENAGKIVKWGMNLRGLDIGSAVASAALHCTSSTAQDQVLPISTLFLSAATCVDDAACLPVERAIAVLKAYLGTRGEPIPDNLIFKPSMWSIDEALPHGGPIHLWLAVKLLESEDYAELDSLIAILESKSAYWKRQCSKLSICSHLKQNRIEKALRALDSWYRNNSLYALEFPAESLFSGRKWSDFRSFDFVTTAIVAHHEATSRGNANVAYICKMACRNFWLSGGRQRVVDDYQIASTDRKSQIIAFFRDVWIEENLSMCHQFESTFDIRNERIGVLQLLIAWEEDRASDYAEAIKHLTFDQTLQQGLQRIDQTRVFVNESAITRWAEKELEQDYERWRKLGESNSGGRTVDGMLRQYALDQINIEVLKEFAQGKATAADALLIDILDRLLKRFLLDPTDGLDTHLSVRIRHGSLRGTILGPFEEQSLLYSTTGFSKEAFESRWAAILGVSSSENEDLINILENFSKEVTNIVDEFVDQRVQIQRAEKPNGAFMQVLSPLSARIAAAGLAERPPSFHAFLCDAYFVFWRIVEAGLLTLRAHVNDVLATTIHERAQLVVNRLRNLGPKYLPLVTTLTTASTMTKSQCDTVAEWFQLPSKVGSERYQLPAAIEIASVATKNVHRAFRPEVKIKSLPATPLPLTISGLSVLMDCLFVVFENAWKHSGLAGDLPPIELQAEFNEEARLLTLTCRNALSEKRRNELLLGELDSLRKKYLGELPLELIGLEGGSGFPKLARLARGVSRELCTQPLEFGILDEQWFTRLTVPVYEREGAFEVYE